MSLYREPPFGNHASIYLVGISKAALLIEGQVWARIYTALPFRRFDLYGLFVPNHDQTTKEMVLTLRLILFWP